MWRIPSASLVCVGSELLSGFVNTHQAWLSLKLRAAGFEVIAEASVPDDKAAIAAAIRRALRAADAVIVCGGLGPTFDDLTREAAAAALGRPMRLRPALWAGIRARFRRSGVKAPESNKRQAWAIAGARTLSNPNGSAPGQLLRAGRKTLALLPGPAPEMYPMFLGTVLPVLKRRHARGLFPAGFTARLSGIPESAADERLAPARARWPRARFTILASGGEVSFHASIVERSKARATAAAAALRRDVLAAVGPFVHAEGDEALEAALGRKLRARRRTLAVAESCTGGLLGGRITSVPGASGWFRGGIIAYANDVKTRRLEVPSRLLARFGAVSAECASAMAEGARRALDADLGLAITGVAGPGGGTKRKPVGLVFAAASGPGSRSRVQRLVINGSRETVRQRAVVAALRLALDQL